MSCSNVTSNLLVPAQTPLGAQVDFASLPQTHENLLAQIEALTLQNQMLRGAISGQIVDLAYLFASPLVRRKDGVRKRVAMLDCLQEYQGILEGVQDAGVQLRVSAKVATRSNFREILLQQPKVLHFSGHGMLNNREDLGENEWALHKEDNDLLVLEDEYCQAEYLYVRELEQILDRQTNDFKVVFISACHSQSFQHVFLNAGAEHVICVAAEDEISDFASLLFAKVFYRSIFALKVPI